MAGNKQKKPEEEHLINGIPRSAIYLDQAMVRSNYLDRTFFSAYTPYGIQMLDSAYSRRIRRRPLSDDDQDPEDPLVLAKEILEDPHLHDSLKENLIFNLKNYNKGFTEKIDGIADKHAKAVIYWENRNRLKNSIEIEAKEKVDKILKEADAKIKALE